MIWSRTLEKNGSEPTSSPSGMCAPSDAKAASTSFKFVTFRTLSCCPSRPAAAGTSFSWAWPSAYFGLTKNAIRSVLGIRSRNN